MNPAAAADSDAPKAPDGATTPGGTAAAAPPNGEGGASGRTTPAWNGLAGQTPEDVSRLARAALQTPALFTGGAAAPGSAGADGANAAAAAAAAAAGSLMDPMNAQALSADQLASLLAASGGGAYAGLGALGGAGLPTDQATLNALLLSGGLGLGQFGGMLNPAGLGDLSALSALMGGGGDGGDLDDGGGGGGGKGGLSANANKQLSSRFRGVCWNKKNKRWQAAINSSGKYLYLGSYTVEDEAARQFDKAAIKLRGKKAKLNFDYAEYVDEHGELLEDIQLPSGALTGGKDGEGGGGGGSGRPSTGGGRRSKAAQQQQQANSDGGALDMSFGGLAAAFGMQGGDFMNQATLAALMGQPGAWGGGGRAGKTAALVPAMGLADEQVRVLLPTNSTLEYTVQPTGQADANIAGTQPTNTLFGIVFKEESGVYGAACWTGYMLKVLGQYDSTGAAEHAAKTAAELLLEDRDLRVSGGLASGITRGLGSGSPNSAAAAAAAAGGQDALALASLAALGQPGGRVAGGAAGGLGIANVSLAHASQLAQAAAAEQGLPMSYPPLSVALPAMSGGLTLAALPLGVGGAGGVDAALLAASAAGGVTSEAEMQQLMQQLMQQSGADGGAAAAGMGGGFLKLGNLDMAQLKAQLEAAQGQHPDAAAAAAVEGDDAAMAAAAAGLAGVKRAMSDEEGGDDADGGAAKRARTDGGVGPDADAAAAAAAVGGVTDVSQLALQDALKMLSSVQQAQGGDAAAAPEGTPADGGDAGAAPEPQQ